MPQTRSQRGKVSPFPTTPSQNQKHKSIAKSLLSKKKLRSLLHHRLFSHQKPSQLTFPQTKDRQDLSLSLSALIPLQKLNCPVCLQVFVCPTLAECGHAFCLSCAEQSLKHKATCAVCRKWLSFEEFKPSKTLGEILNKKLENQSDQSVLSLHQQRLSAFQEQEQKRRVSEQLKLGDLVDYWNDRRWREGKVITIEMTAEGNRYNIQPISRSPLPQTMALAFNHNSRLIAKYRTFTKEVEPLHSRLTQFRIQIFDFRNTLEQSLFFSLMDGNRRMQVSLRDEEGEDSRMRFALSFDHRQRHSF